MPKLNFLTNQKNFEILFSMIIELKCDPLFEIFENEIFRINLDLKYQLHGNFHFPWPMAKYKMVTKSLVVTCDITKKCKSLKKCQWSKCAVSLPHVIHMI